MNKRIVIKTTAVCLGIFILLVSTAAWYIFHNYELDTEKRYRVLVATTDINPGDVINESMVAYRTIKESAYSTHMVLDADKAVENKSLCKIAAGDYIIDYNLLPSDQWHTEDDKIIVLPMDIEGRLANLIKKGSYIDIKVVLKDSMSIPSIVLSRIRVEDILDENGISMGDSIGSKKAYAEVVLNSSQRDRIYVASQLGKLIFELYCDPTQKAAPEEFHIPAGYLKNNPEHSLNQSTERSSGKATEQNAESGTSSPAQGGQ